MQKKQFFFFYSNHPSQAGAPHGIGTPHPSRAGTPLFDTPGLYGLSGVLTMHFVFKLGFQNGGTFTMVVCFFCEYPPCYLK